jgi:hypothetical protein
MSRGREKGTKMQETKKRGIYLVESYDGTIRKMYANYKSAYKYANKLAREEKWCSLLEVTDDGIIELAAC